MAEKIFWVVYGQQGRHDSYTEWAIRGFETRAQAEKYAIETAVWFVSRVPPHPLSEHYISYPEFQKISHEYHEERQQVRKEIEASPYDPKGKWHWASGEAVTYTVRQISVEMAEPTQAARLLDMMPILRGTITDTLSPYEAPKPTPEKSIRDEYQPWSNWITWGNGAGVEYWEWVCEGESAPPGNERAVVPTSVFSAMLHLQGIKADVKRLRFKSEEDAYIALEAATNELSAKSSA